MRYALHAEWTKLRTTPAAACLLLAAVALTVLLSAAAATCHTTGCRQDPVRTSLTGVDLGQALVAVLAVVMIGGEYGSGMIRTTLAAMPRRGAVLAAKAAILAGVVAAASLPAVFGSLLFGLPTLSLADSSTLRAAGGSVLYLALVALLGLGIATAVRDSATAVGAVLALLYLFPVLASVVTNPHWERHLRQIGPMNAGLAIQATAGVDQLPIGPWTGLGVLAAWSAAALLAGGLLLRWRDA